MKAKSGYMAAILLLLAAVPVAFWAGRSTAPLPVARDVIAMNDKAAAHPAVNVREHLRQAVEGDRKVGRSLDEPIRSPDPSSNPPPARPGRTPPSLQVPHETASVPNRTIDPPVPAAKLLSDFINGNRDSVFVDSMTQGHDATQAEQIDPAWSPSANQQLRDYIAQQFGDRFETPVIDCRTDICELMAAGRVGGSMSDDSMDFQRAMSTMHKQAWWSMIGFDQQWMSVSTSPDGRPLFILYITRK
jgi:hypothetical protein